MAKLSDKFRGRLPKPQVEIFHTGHAKSWFWRILPSPVASLIGVLLAGSITGLALYAGDRLGHGQGYLWSMVVIGIMTVVVGIAAWVKHRRLKGKVEAERAAGFEEAIRGSSGGWDSSVSDAAEIARLDDLRTKFHEGLKVFHDYGKDLYELPWYVIVGEPGSGKTEAIRHSELRFPQGLHEKLQGVGGTYSMNWWFTNNAVLLDTAGAMLTQPEAAERFGEFLRLLREYRTDFPLNGLILTIPVDQLLINPAHVAEEKARGIARQLSIVQQALDVRFPIYLLISKSDRLPGFREFFDAEGQAAFELQMVGWSNPDAVGTPFDPARIREALGAVADRLHSRALMLLSDPIPRVEGRRRLDEVDSIYAFPETIRALEERLRWYLDTIFQTGAWAGKAPFFRGLYFTSAMRQGSELDQALAAALQVDVEKLPSGGIFTQDKAVFIRDVFLSKIFPERGLVSRLRDLGALLRRRLLLYYGAAWAVLLIALLLTWWVGGVIKGQLRDEQRSWLKANGTWNNGTLLAPLVRRSSNPDLAPKWEWVDLDDPLSQTQKVLDFTAERPRLGWVFRPIKDWREFEQQRRAAALTLFEASVFKPVLDAARERIRWDTAENARRPPETEERLAKAYVQLVKLELWTADSTQEKSAPSGPKEWQTFFEDLLAYVFDAPSESMTARAARLVSLMPKAYGTTILLSSRDWLAENEQEKGYSALHHAAVLLFGQTELLLDTQDRRADTRRRRQELLQNFRAAEKKTLEWSAAPGGHNRAQIEAECMEPMREAVKSSAGLLAEERGGAKTTVRFAVISEAARTTLTLLDSPRAGPTHVLHDFHEKATQLAGSRDAGSDDSDWVSAQHRFEKYEKSFMPMTMDEVQFPRGELVGHLKEKLEFALRKVADRPVSASPATPPAAPVQDEEAIARYLQTFRGDTLVNEVLKEYRRQLGVIVNTRLKFPLVDTAQSHKDFEEFRNNCGTLANIEKDRDALSAMTEPALEVEERDRLRRGFESLQSVFGIATTMLKGNIRILVDDPVLPPAAPAPYPPNPGFPVLPVQQIGVTSIDTFVLGTHYFGRLDGQPTDCKYNGYGPVKIVVKRSVSGFTEPRESVFRADGLFEVLRRAVTGRKNRLPIGDSGLGFGIDANPPLPFDHWPKVKDLDLQDKP